MIEAARAIHCGQEDFYFPVNLSAPRNPRTGNHSWSNNNISKCIDVSQLSTACHEPRSRMLKYSRPRKRGEESSQRSLLLHAVKTRVLHDSGERQHITIRPRQDLVYIELAKGATLRGWLDGADIWWNALMIFPVFNHRVSTESGEIQIQLILRHVAFDPRWKETILGWKSACSAFWSLSKSGLRYSMVCFIDYGLQRSRKVDRPGRRRFFCKRPGLHRGVVH